MLCWSCVFALVVHLVFVNQAGQVVQESVHGIRTVAAFNLQREMGDRYAERLREPQEKGIKSGHTAGIGFGFSQFIMMAVYVRQVAHCSTLLSFCSFGLFSPCPPNCVSRCLPTPLTNSYGLSYVVSMGCEL